ncbi:histidinol-phosphatase [Halodesulfovibrio sp.]|jgi:histidinol-phosphatase (PHP family)|uniref:histidinol-phosphatase n=1 Tax=Halodesulfovibrio sp. TaxID=1912772 RepID=UPI0025E7F483|nr:histidinol-phosphatase [Halodesulfovibrio sp.]MCT4625829.1 histidinol-phosphatase [Halodesulfovibrio sp.]
MISIDTHIHTKYSHGKATPQEMYNAALEKGLKVFGFSEHSARPSGMDYPREYREHLAAHWDIYIEQVTALKNNNDGVTVLLGIEMDWMEGNEEFIRAELAKNSYDYVLCGIHFLENWGFDYTKADWESLKDDELTAIYEKYFNTMVTMARTGIFNTIAHPDIIKIFSCSYFSQWIATKEAQQLVTEALTAVRDAGMSMEISSAGIRKLCQEIYPCETVMGIASKLELPITFGSDAHSTMSVAYSFDKLEEYARRFGYSESVYFKNGKMHSRPF